MTMRDDFAARILLGQRLEREAEARRIAAIIAAGPPAGFGLSAEAWSNWHRYGFVVCPGRKGGLACDQAECGIGASCAVLAAKGQHGDGSAMSRRERPACGAKTRAGGTCAMRVEPGKHRCRLHGGLSTGPRTEEGRRKHSERMKALWAARKARVE